MYARKCKLDTCQSRVKARGLCASHYNTEIRHENGTYTTRRVKNAKCSIGECNKVVQWKKLCSSHYYELVTKPNRALKPKTTVRTMPRMSDVPCSQCGAPSWSNNMCQLHYNEFKLSPEYAEGLWQFVKKELNLV